MAMPIETGSPSLSASRPNLGPNLGLESACLHQMMAWLSPSYPIGAFSYSHGLEYAMACGDLANGEDLQGWLCDLLRRGSGWNDAILLCHAYHAQDQIALSDLSELAQALCASSERHLESMAQGTAFAKVTQQVFALDMPPAPLPIAIGWAAQQQDLALSRLLPLYLHSFAANLISAAIRFMPLGQTDGQRLLASLFPLFDDVATQAQQAGLNDLGSSCFLADMAAMHHETMTTRIFRT
ncbi:MAG: urease accessory protein UreF [Cohaesibacter sp.]|nr:urease accessory protein UreF [Cohaesibacter sp.]